MKLTRKLLAAMLSVCMVLAILTPASAAELSANYNTASYYDVAVTTYSRMLAFQNGVVAAANTSKQYGLIDYSGKVVLPFQYAYVWALGGDKFAVAQKENEYGDLTGLGVVNSAGKTVLAPSQDCTQISSRNGVICVTTRTKSTSSTWGGYDYTNTYYTTDWKPSTDAAYQGGSGDDSYVDNTPAALKQYDYFEEVDGCYRVHQYDKNWNEQVGLLDSQFKVVIPLGQYKYVGTTNKDGYTSVTKLDGSTDLYKGGKVVKTFQDKEVTTEVYFRHLAFTLDGEKHGMMDVNEKVLLPARYDTIDNDGNGNLLTVTCNDDSWEYIYGLYTQDCKEIFADKYSEITYLAESKYRLNDGKYYGVSKVSGTAVTPVIPMKYLDMRTYTLQFIELYDGSKYSVVDLNNNVVVPESTEEIDVFNGDEGGLWETLDRVEYYAEEYDGYTKSVLPFISKTGSGYLTTYADYNTGKTEGQLTVRASNLDDGGWFAYQNANGLYGIGRLSTGFLDIEPGSWKDDSASWAAAKKITDGVGGGRFDPDKNCTNAQIITFLYRAKTGNIVSGANWDVDAINWAREQGMIDDSFDKNQNCTRASALKFIWQAFGSQKPEKESSFTDVPAGADYADAVSWAVNLPTPITNGYGATFGPNEPCSRAHIVTFLFRAYGNT